MSQKKQRERQLLEAFFSALGREMTIVDGDREAPDFIVGLSDELIGIELTDIYTSHETDGDVPQTQESISDRIVEQARRLYEDSGAPPAYVRVCFLQNADLRVLDRRAAAAAISDVVKGLRSTEGQDVEWRWHGDGHLLAGQIAFVRAFGVPRPEMALWTVLRAAWAAPLSVEMLQARVDEKAKKLADYRKAVGTNWLIVTCDRFRPSQLFASEIRFDPIEVNSPFEKTFFYAYPDKQIIQLGSG